MHDSLMELQTFVELYYWVNAYNGAMQNGGRRG